MSCLRRSMCGPLHTLLLFPWPHEVQLGLIA